MEVSIFLAKVFSVYFLLIGVAMLVQKKYFKQAVVELINSPGVSLWLCLYTAVNFLYLPIEPKIL